MKRNILRIVTALAALLGAASALDINGIAGALPPEYARWFTIAALASLGVKELAVVIGDLLDNGKRDNSFPN